jgi:putative addiction module killer protein
MEVRITATIVFNKWFDALRDIRARSIIGMHIDRIADGNLGMVKPAGNGVFEKKIYYGAGYRLYFYNQGLNRIILLCGGDKSTQSKDIKLAQKLKKEVEKW